MNHRVKQQRHQPTATQQGDTVMASLLMASSLFLGVGDVNATEVLVNDAGATELGANETGTDETGTDEIVAKEREASQALVSTTKYESRSETDPLAGAKIEAALVYYQERDRVTAAEGIIHYRQALDDSNTLRAKIALDALTGASANGAVIQARPQSFTRPSGTGVYQARAGELPLDDTFKDTRLQLSANWQHLFSAKWQMNLGGYLSREYDYTSIGVNGSGEHSFNQSNTQVFFGSAYYFDIVDPVGGRPVGLSEMVFRKDFASEEEFRQAFDATRRYDSALKRTLDLNLGVTQTLNTHWQAQLSYSLSAVSGYLSDAYKVVSRIDGVGQAQGYHYEARPDQRLKHNLFAMAKGALTSGTLTFSYRYSDDDWSIQAHTLDARYRYNLTDGGYWQWQFRAYLQQAAEFYRLYLSEGEALPEFASADHRLGKLETYTLGVKYAHKLDAGQLASIRLAYYQQRPQNPGISLPGELASYDQFPRLDAIVLQLGMRF
ncbi:DUF3570 domain-containing protein [Shewanella marisflavi]|uniref:DUF3570 domain-containing protein n=1 Tax=Shewanella marisflavi TaxID=260364 RepID=UPI00200D38EC|nr:DUF3570 domain-containing protein [Shewanella marisflavi]